ncbi:WD40 repeat-like protein [Wolfiporia cocos MD-104 SS10]|uniref:WD40 repeat-like protein n=1 Tax=Wolfiporia cocos (strain MD-104) TaxID=742152 RepID=A0A2H3J6F0_WOLCO|nr:WD40 repeat-like protein [Wolfiporia cocos MD-104 SS10]
MLCDTSPLPRVTTAILGMHTDEVWNMEWSHNGQYLASASKDKTAIIWQVEHDKDPSVREIFPKHILREHKFPVGCVAWSPKDDYLLTASENEIRLWDVERGTCIARDVDYHSELVTALAWLPDNAQFISGGLDQKIIIWDLDCKPRDSWSYCPIRVMDLTLTPDFSRVVAIGMYDVVPEVPPVPTPPENGVPQARPTTENRVIVYDLATKQPETFISTEGELTSVKISLDSRCALINSSAPRTSPGEIILYDLELKQIVRKFTGHKQSRHVIRGSLGGYDGNFLASGSEDGIVYIWHRDSGKLLEALAGHGSGSVNSVAWNPHNVRMLASCSDDKTIRIWEAPPSVASGAPVNSAEPAEPATYEQDGGKGKG